jgi:hypothetical protein
VFITSNPAKLSFIFLNFLRFSMQFTRIGKPAKTIQDPVYIEVPGNFLVFTHMPLLSAKVPGKKVGLTIESLGGGRRRGWPNFGEAVGGFGRGKG